MAEFHITPVHKVFADEAIDVISALPVDVLHDDHFFACGTAGVAGIATPDDSEVETSVMDVLAPREANRWEGDSGALLAGTEESIRETGYANMVLMVSLTQRLAGQSGKCPR